MSKMKTVKTITGYNRIDGVVPGIRGQRAFPTHELRTFDPFVMLDHIGPQRVDADYYMNGAGHPHRGFETITFMFEGVMHHVDSLGNKTKLTSGSVQRMNAGKGIQHGGDMEADPTSQRFHEVQLWVNLPASHKMSEPNIHNASIEDIPVIKKDGYDLRVVAGPFMGTQGPIQTTAEMMATQLVNVNGGKIEITGIPAHQNTLIYVLEGSAQVNGTALPAQYTATFNHDGDDILLTSTPGTQMLLISGKAINEPVAMGGPFVMNTQEEIEQAYADFQAGLFGTI